MEHHHCGAALPSPHRPTRSFIAFCLPLLLLGLLAAPTSALSASPNRDIAVCPGGPPQCEFAAIQPALDAAAPGDRVLVAPGVYTGQLTLKSGVTLSSTAGAEGTIVRALEGPIVTGNSVVSATVRGLTISGQGMMTGTVGIDLHDSELSLFDSILSDFKGRDGVQGAPGGETAIALRSAGASRLALDGVTIQGVYGGAGLAGVSGGEAGGDAVGIMATGEVQLAVTRTTFRDLHGGAAGGFGNPSSCTGHGGNAQAVRTSGEVALTVSESRVSGLAGGAPCRGYAAGCPDGGGGLVGISASGGSVLVRDTRFQISGVPVADNNPTGVGVLTAGTHATRLEGVTVTSVSTASAAEQAAALPVGADSPFCRVPAASFVGVVSDDDELLAITGMTVQGLTGVGRGRAGGVEASRAGDVIATGNQISNLSGGCVGTTAYGFDLSGVGSALVLANRITDLHSGDGPSELYYLDGGYDGGSAFGVRVTASATATVTVASNVIASLTGGAGSSMQNYLFPVPGRNGGDAVAVSISGGLAHIANNTLYQTVAGRPGMLPKPGQPGHSAALWVTGEASARATNNVLAQHAAGVLGAAPAAIRLSSNDLWGNVADYAGVAPGVNDVHLAPGFMDANASDFHLRPDSALVDAGSNRELLPNDIDGEPRPQDGNGDKVAVADIGADEYWPGLHGVMTVDPDAAHPGDVLTYRVDLSISTPPYAASSVGFTDALPGGLPYVPGSLRASGGAASEAGGTIRWSGSVSRAAPVSLTFQARVGDEPGPRSLLNVAELQDGASAPVELSARAWIDPRTFYLPTISWLP